MKWTQDTPAMPAVDEHSYPINEPDRHRWYWFREWHESAYTKGHYQFGEAEMCCVYIGHRDGRPVLMVNLMPVSGRSSNQLLADLRGEWCGPIEKPSEVASAVMMYDGPITVSES